MLFRPKHPAVPLGLLDQMGDPEQVFGPNVRLRVVAVVCGAILIAMGVIFLLLGVGALGPDLPLHDKAGRTMGLCLTMLGMGFLVIARTSPLPWVLVCPRGLIRTRGAEWVGIAWADVERFEDASLSRGAVTATQCRLVLRDGTEAGFVADFLADYRGLSDALQQKVGASQRPPETERALG